MVAADLVAIVLTGVVAVVVILTTLAVLWLAVTQPDRDLVPIVDAIGRIVGVLVGALVGFMAGRRLNGH